MRRAHCYVSEIRRRLSHVSRQGAGGPSTGSTGTTVSIFLGRDSEARELCAELGGHKCVIVKRERARITDTIARLRACSKYVLAHYVRGHYACASRRRCACRTEGICMYVCSC